MADDVGQEEFTMRSVKVLTIGAVVAVSLIGVSSASAADWHPQNTNFTLTQEGSSTFTGNSNVTCTSGHANLRASGAVAGTTTTVNPISFTGCSNPILGPAVVTTFGTWTFTATSTTAVDITASSTTGVVATIAFGACTITVDSSVHISANTWNNANHTLGINSGSAFGITGPGICALAGTSMRLDANFVAPAATIT